MSVIAERKRLRPARALVLENVDWKTYTRLLWALAEQPKVRLTYDRGRLEIMSPVLEHEDDDRFLGRMVVALTEELGLSLKSGGSTTLRRRLRERGLEADECYWIANAHQMRGRRRLNLRKDPPPDLALEVDVTHSSLDRLAIYAVLQVPEVWRLEKSLLHFYGLTPDGAYQELKCSPAFPMVTPAILMRFLTKAREAGDQNPVMREFRAWVRQNRKS